MNRSFNINLRALSGLFLLLCIQALTACSSKDSKLFQANVPTEAVEALKKQKKPAINAESQLKEQFKRMFKYSDEYKIAMLEPLMGEEGKQSYYTDVINTMHSFFMEPTPLDSEDELYKKFSEISNKYGVKLRYEQWPEIDRVSGEYNRFEKKIFDSLGPMEKRSQLMQELLGVIMSNNILYVNPFDVEPESVTINGDSALLTASDFIDQKWIHKFEKSAGVWQWQGNEYSAANKRELLADVKLEGDTLSGKRVDLKSYLGQYVLIDFWATWCGPCLAEMPKLKKIHSALSKKGFAIIGVAQDVKESLENYFEDHNLPWDNILDEDGAIATQFDIKSYPTKLLIDPQGRHIGWDLSDKELLNELESGLGLKPEDTKALRE